MKKHIFSLLILLAGLPTVTQAQVTISLNVDSNPNPRIADWVDKTSLAILTINNTNPNLEGTDIIIQVKMYLNGKLVIQTKDSQMPKQSLEFGTMVLYANDIIPYNALQFMDGFEQPLIKTGLLPSGVYSFCTSVADTGGKVISKPAEACKPMTVTSYQAPELIKPTAAAELPSATMLGQLFTWTPLMPAPSPEQGLEYVIRITEVKSGQTPSQAFLTNYPIVEENVGPLTQFLWPADIDIPKQNTTYAWAIKAVNNNDVPYLSEQSGFSKIGTFTIMTKQDEEDISSETFAKGDTIYAGLNGEFAVIIDSVKPNGNKYQGNGFVKVNWLMARFAVDFDSVAVDKNKRVLTGKIVTQVNPLAPKYPLDWALEASSVKDFAHSTVQSMSEWVNSVSGQAIPFANKVEPSQPLKMPLGLVFDADNQLAITEMVFRADKSEMNIVASKFIPASITPDALGFIAKGLPVYQSGPKFPPKRIELVSDFTIGAATDKTVYVFKKPTSSISGTYLEWGETGFSKIGLELDVLFTREWLKPVPDKPGEKSKATFSVVAKKWNDLILGGKLSPSELVGTGGMKMQADSIFIDLSDTMNPKAIVFPPNYSGETGVMFHGFYMKTFTVDLPETWKTQSAAPKITLSNMIIDKMGITMKAKATNIIQYPNAAVADMIASVDTVKVELIASSLVEAGIRGRIGLPFTQKSSTQNPLVYKALLSIPKKTAKGSFLLTIDPTGPIKADLFTGEFTLDKTSIIKAVVDSTKKTFDLNLNGSFGWKNINLGVVKNVTLGLKFQGLGMKYDSSNNSGLTFNKGSWSFASPQKYLANFPVSISDVGFKPLSLQSGQLLHGKLTLDVVFNLSEDIGGKSQLGVEVAVMNNQNGQKFYPKYITTTIDKINISANLPAVTINGALELRNEDPVYGNGFKGELSADFKPVGVKLSALAEFGNTKYQNGAQFYRYWRVEANATLPPPGVVFLPGVAFRGFGGGVYYNMTATQKSTSFNMGPNSKAYDFTPKKSTLGMSIMTTLASTPKEEAFNGDVTLRGEFSTSNGLTFITFAGDLWAGADLSTSSRNKALVKGIINATYNHPNRHFNFSTQVNVNAYPITTPNPISLVLDIRGKENKWYFKMGEPQNPNGIDVFGYYSYSYFMIGNDIPTPQGFTPTFANAFKSHVGGNPPSVGSGGVNDATKLGTGIAAGIGWKFSSSGEVDVIGFGVGYEVGAGAELHLALFDYSGSCGSHNPIGINGWRAVGGLGFYGSARLYGKIFGEKFNVLGIGGGAWVYGEFPNPYYVAGNISGYITILLVDIDVSIDFEAGQKCSNAQAPGSSATFAQGDAAADQQNQLIQYVKTQPMTSFPVEEPIKVKFGLNPNEVFNVAEQQANGSVKNRTFKMEYTRTLESKDAGGSYTTVATKKDVNNLGEHLFTVYKQTRPNINTPVDITTPNVSENYNPASIGAGVNPVSGGLSGAVGLGTTGAFPGLQTTRFTAPKFPAAPSQPNYGNLPPENEPPVNALTPNTYYRFTVVATLKELKNNTWVNAYGGSGIVEKKIVNEFNTMVLNNLSGNNPSINTGAFENVIDPLDKAKKLPGKIK